MTARGRADRSRDYSAVMRCDAAGVWAFHCHILPHVEGLDGMFGMVTTFIVQ